MMLSQSISAKKASFMIRPVTDVLGNKLKGPEYD